MAVHDINNFDHDPQLAIAFGNVMVAWANAETHLLFAFSAVTGMPVNLAMDGYYRIPTFEARVKVIRALLAETKANLPREAVDAAILAISRLSKTRNDWVHGVWCHDREANKTVIIDMRASVAKGRQKPVKAHDMNDHANAVRTRSKFLKSLLPELTYD